MQVTLPEQELNDGVVHLKVVQVRVGAVGVEGDRFASPANIRNSMPALRPGKIPKISHTSASLKLAGSLHGRTSVLQRGTEVKTHNVHTLPEVKPVCVGSLNSGIELKNAAIFSARLGGYPLQKCLAAAARARAGRCNQVVYLNHSPGSQHFDDPVARYRLHVAICRERCESEPL